MGVFVYGFQAPAVESSGGAGPTLQPRNIFSGHENTVNDVQFHPSSEHNFCSVGDDSALLFWDARSGTDPVNRVARAHEGDVHCCDWNKESENYVITGAEDAAVKLFDIRKVEDPLHTFKGHKEAVICLQVSMGVGVGIGCGCAYREGTPPCKEYDSVPVLRGGWEVGLWQWCPGEGTVFASGAEDRILNVWDIGKVGGHLAEVGRNRQSIGRNWRKLAESGGNRER